MSRRIAALFFAISVVAVPTQALAVQDTVAGPISWDLTCNLATPSCGGSASALFAGNHSDGFPHEEVAVLVSASTEEITLGACVRIGAQFFLEYAYGTVRFTPQLAVRGINFGGEVIVPFYWNGVTGEVTLGSLRPSPAPLRHTRIDWSFDEGVTRDAVGGAGVGSALIPCGGTVDFLMTGYQIA